MLQPIGLSSAAPLIVRAASQNTLLLSSIHTVALSALAGLAATLHVVPTLLPAMICVVIGVSVALSLFHSIRYPDAFEARHVSFTPLFRPFSYEPLPVYTPAPVRTFYPWVIQSDIVESRPVCVQPRRVIEARPRAPFRQDLVGERRPVVEARPCASFRQDRVGERRSF